MSGTVGTASVGETLRDFWAHRPSRPKQGRKIAGVATGIAQRYQIDPVIVRVGFVVAALSNGVGLLLYVLGWLWLPEEGDEVSPAEALIHKGHSSMSSGLTVLLGLSLIPMSGFLISGGFPAISIALLAAGGIFLLQRYRGHLAPATVVTEQETVVIGPQPPAWDPLGAAPFAWDLPEPSPVDAPEPPAPRRRKNRTGLVTFGVVLLVIVGSGIAGQWSSWFSPAHVIGLIVGVLALGLIASALTGGRKGGLIALVVPLSVIGIVFTQFQWDGEGQVGDVKATPAALAEVNNRYETSVGTVELDLRSLPNSGDVRTVVEVAVGEAIVRVPRDADVDLICSSNVGGSLDCLGQHSDGRRPRLEIENNNGPDGEGGLKINLEVHSNVGSVRVTRD